MALLKKLKYAFGLSPDDGDELIADDPETESLSTEKAGNVVLPKPQAQQARVEIALGDDEAMAAIFEHVVETFNKSLPDFLKQSVDAAAERKFLYDTLTGDLKQYLSTIAERTQQKCQESWSEDKQRLQETVRELEAKTRSIEEQREELAQKQLSVERQRRALGDRVVDLEKQVMSFEAEREQYQLENKSLVNKLKVANVNEKDIEAMREEISRLHEELNKARQQNLNPQSDETAVPVVDNSEELKALEAKVSDLESKLAAAEENVANANEQIDDLTAKLAEAESMTQELGEIENQIAQFEKIKQKKDARINDLTDELAKANETIKTLQESAGKVSEEQAQTANSLQAEIEQLKVELEQAKQAKAAEHKPEKRSKSGGQARSTRVEEQNNHLDDILSDTDWLVSPSSLKSNKNGQSNGSNHSGGRQEINDAQMTLF